MNINFFQCYIHDDKFPQKSYPGEFLCSFNLLTLNELEVGMDR